MKFSKKSRYAIAALLDLAIYADKDHVALGSIAERNGISPQYLEQVFAGLRRAGIVKSVKGAQGGYRLGRATHEITVADVLNALEGGYHLEDEQTDPGESGGIPGTIQSQIIDRVNHELDEILNHLTLTDLGRYYLEHQGDGQDMYYI
jgi:Rrf2 family protein